MSISTAPLLGSLPWIGVTTWIGVTIVSPFMGHPFKRTRPFFQAHAGDTKSICELLSPSLYFSTNLTVIFVK